MASLPPLGSMEVIIRTEQYPTPKLLHQDEDLHFGYSMLPGEGLILLYGLAHKGMFALTNYRIFCEGEGRVLVIALMSVESMEIRDLVDLHIFCKDGRTMIMRFTEENISQQCHDHIASRCLFVKKDVRPFCYHFHAWRNTGAEVPCSTNKLVYCFDKEVKRLHFDLKRVKAWRITNVNEKYTLCASYPMEHIVPKDFDDVSLQEAAVFRTNNRFPSIVWRNERTGAVLARCSQPEVGVFGWRNTKDEKLFEAILEACCNDRPKSFQPKSEIQVQIVDARSYTAATANRAKGGGCEFAEYYAKCEITFKNLVNIHQVRKSLHAVRSICCENSESRSWLLDLEKTNWLQNLSGLVAAAIDVARAMELGNPVVVHCSDGWDRTPGIISLAQIILDPFYRTIEGFQTLVEKDWIIYGHKFSDRCGHGKSSADTNERSPIFLQFLDAVHQLTVQFPAAFEFSQAFLIKLVQHVYSTLFGTFLSNTAKEFLEVNASTYSVWLLLNGHQSQFINMLYLPGKSLVLTPSTSLRHLKFWDALFLPETLQPTGLSSVPRVQSEPLVNNRIFRPFQRAQSLEQIRCCKTDLPQICTSHNSKTDDNCDNDLSHQLENCSTETLTNGCSPILNGIHNGGADVALDLHKIQVCKDFNNGDTNDNKEYEKIGDNDDEKSEPNNYGTKHLTDGDSNGSLCQNTDGLKCHNDNENHEEDGNIQDNMASKSIAETGDTDKTGGSDQSNDKFLMNGALFHANGCDDYNTLEQNGELEGLVDELLDVHQVCPTNGRKDPQDVCLDGLFTWVDPYYSRFEEMQMEHEVRIATMQSENELKFRNLQKQLLSQQHDGGLHILNPSSSEGPSSVDSITTSESSWEQIEESEARRTLWFPDHLAKSCKGCCQGFNIMRRRHHCRCCGSVFCYDCAKYFAPVPQQQCLSAVRVCSNCFRQLTNSEGFGSEAKTTSALLRS